MEDLKPLISMDNVSKRYPTFSMENFNLTLNRGEVLGIIGPNGAGKTTCLRLIMGFIEADSGNISVLNKNIRHNAEEIKREVAYVAEDMRLFGGNNLEWHFQFMQSIYPSWDEKYALELLRTFDLNKSQKVKTFSLGQRVKATLLLGLARRPKVLVLDEPSTGLDPIARHELTSELFQIMLNEDHSVIFSSQHTQDVERISDSIAFIDDGELIGKSDKETYLDKWKRVEIPNAHIQPNIAESISNTFPQDITIEQGITQLRVIHGDFSEATLPQYASLGLSVSAIENMSLEEIFIHQILHRRKQRSLGA